MKIAVVTSGFAPGRTGGTETYLRSLLAALQSVDSVNQYTVFVEPRFRDELHVTARNFTTSALRTRARLPLRVVGRLLGLPRPGGRVPDPSMAAAIDRGGFDVVHYPLQIINPWGVRSRKVLTFMDMQHEYLPELFTEGVLQARRETYRPSAEAANHIIAISEFTRQTLLEKYSISPERVSTVRLCCFDGEYGDTGIRQTATVPAPYFLYPAATWPHKNHSRLLEAFARVHAVRPEYRLVLTGVDIANRSIQQMIEGLRLTQCVTMLGYLAVPELHAAYSNAYALVFPSLFEGFGIPLCEAMAAGCPVLASNTTSIPEVAGGAAVYFDPLNPRDIADKMLALIAQPEERQQLIQAGRERVKQFSEDRMARETLSVYELVARTPAGGR